MREKLISGFTLNFSFTKDSYPIGGYLKATPEGIVPSELNGEEIIFISNFPNIMEKIANKNILQIYKTCDGYCSIVGEIKREGPYAEDKYFDVTASSVSDNLIDSLNNLNKEISKEEISHQKIYYRYGSDKYRLI